MHYLITPNPEGPDSILQVTGFGKQGVPTEVLPTPVVIGGHTIVGYPKLSRWEMSGHQGTGAAYHILMNTLESPETALALDPDFAKAWDRLCGVAGVWGVCPVLLVDQNGKIRLFTFDSTGQLESSVLTVLEFAEPTMYQQGRILTFQVIMNQVLERRRKKDENLKRAFDLNDDRAGFNLHELDTE